MDIEKLIKELTNIHHLTICYVTSSKTDPVLNSDNDKILSFYIGDGITRTNFFINLKADILVMTMPDLETFHIKRSKVHNVHYVYVFHSIVSTHMIYEKNAFDSFDTIFCVGKHHINEIHKNEKKYNLPTKKLIEFGYGKLDQLIDEANNKKIKSVQKNNRTRYIALCDFLKTEYSIIVKDIIPEEGKPFSKIYNKNKKELLLSDFNSLETKKLYAAAQIAQEGSMNEINEYLSKFTFPSEESKKLTQIALLNYCGAAILMPYKLFHTECKRLKYDLELLQNTFATSFEQVAHRVTCLQDPKLPGIPFHMLRVDVAGNISKRFSLSGIQIPRYGGACPRWNVYSAFTRPGVIQAAVSKMANGEKYVCISRTVEKGIGKFGQSKSILSIGLGCEAKYAKDFVYTESMNINDKTTEIPIGVSCRTCDRLDCSQRAFPPLHKKFDVDINARGVSVYVSD